MNHLNIIVGGFFFFLEIGKLIIRVYSDNKKKYNNVLMC